MAKIQQLSPHVADLIAAGEVVERPASAAKELVENSIDAGAKNVTVEIQNGGMTFLRVTDDGCGMLPEDAQTAFLRHATSKLRTERDLEAIHTLGFRGEALAAICAVSRIDLMTKTAESDFGTSLHLEAGEITVFEEAGCPNGTTIIVRDLFFNTPARMKFMKRDTVEGAAVVSAVAKLALAHPEVSIRVIKDGKEELHTTGDGQLLSAIRSVMGRQSAQEMVELNSHFEKYTLTGFISKPSATRGNRSNQIFFVNGRHVRSKTMTAALEAAYANCMMVGRFPSCVLHLRLPENLVDVNVHPAKIEVKFINERDIFDCIRYGVEGALDKAPAKVQMKLPEKPAQPKNPPVQVASPSAVATKQETFRTVSVEAYRAQAPKQAPRHTMSAEDYRAFAKVLQQAPRVQPHEAVLQRLEAIEKAANKPVGTSEDNNVIQPETKAVVNEGKAPRGSAEFVCTSDSVSQAPLKDMPDLPTLDTDVQEAAQQTLELPTQAWRVIGEVLDTYILVEQGRSLLLIDKHAAHERLLFEKFRKQNEPIMPQLLLSPILCELEREEAALLCENEELLSQYGFSVSDYGEGTLAVHQIPSELKADAACDTLSEIAANLKNGKKLSKNELRDTLLHTVACKAAVKGGQHSDEKERQAIVREVLCREDLKYCPHGRPICVELTAAQLEKQFKR